jgi:hypothetical protein
MGLQKGRWGCFAVCRALPMRLLDAPRRRGRGGPSELMDRFHAVRASARPLGSGDSDDLVEGGNRPANTVVTV